MKKFNEVCALVVSLFLINIWSVTCLAQGQLKENGEENSVVRHQQNSVDLSDNNSKTWENLWKNDGNSNFLSTLPPDLIKQILSLTCAKTELNNKLRDISALGSNIKKMLEKNDLELLPKKVLVFAPHPDDDIIGCGGSIAKHRKNGHEVTIVYMTSGDAGGVQYSKEELARIREQEATSATNILGVKHLIFLQNPDGYLTYDEKNLVKLINIIRQEHPDIVYLPHRFDLHSDHVVTYDLVLQAIKRAAGTSFQECVGEPWKVKIILCYEVWTPLQTITYFEDISDFMELKLQALRQHVSQLTRLRYDSAVEGLDLYRGIMSRSCKYSEGFQILEISNKDLASIIQG